MAKKEQNQPGIAEQLQPLVDDDAFLTHLSQGQDPSDGEDELAALFLELREDVEKQMPPAPLIEGAEMEPEVISLGAARKRRRNRPFLNGLVGAAAATVLIAGAGAVAINTGVISTEKENPSVVELAGTLEEMDKRSAEGDMDGTRQLLEEARKLVNQVNKNKADEKQREAATTNRTTVTATATVEKEPEKEPTESPAPVTVTENQTVVSTVVVTSTVNPGNPLFPPTGQQTEPTSPGDNGNEESEGNGGHGGNGDNGLLPPPQFQQ
ncbi:hypothetical protein [Corynebacterium sp.]|uniref:hypothetical protein n=1 Tax=Corynebacterium sp. TaxID=1720 RepID=UPI0026DD5226|nr:hypothetical protein [Corynebacterium sp.]MDO5031245.1 hypothetical protein [Corynebacterium sp.]